jgi:hypothetical protein
MYLNITGSTIERVVISGYEPGDVVYWNLALLSPSSSEIPIIKCIKNAIIIKIILIGVYFPKVVCN